MTWYWLGAGGIVLALMALYDGFDPLLGVIAAGMIVASYKLHEQQKSPRHEGGGFCLLGQSRMLVLALARPRSAVATPS